ncbi:MAG: dienelactone hydrolase family protein [Phormidesmis sp.]
MSPIKRVWNRLTNRLTGHLSGKTLWSILFAIALSITFLFQACGTSAPDTASSNADAPALSQSDGQQSDGNINTLAQEHSGDKPTATPAAMAEPTVPVTGESVTYATVEGQPITGYLAQPTDKVGEALPALITIHEWWGLNENIEAMTRRLAGEGYTVLAIDLYGGQFATDPTEASELVRSVMDNPGPAQDNLFQAAEFLKSEYNAPALGSIGWCFGGNWSLRTGLLLSSDLDAIAIYYGQLILAPEALDALDMPVIGFFGEDDSSIAVEDVNNFESTLTDLGKTVDINLYPGVGHAFANPSGQNYNAAAAEDAWTKTVAFFNTYLQ